ncbi:MAG: SEL1-like repeat protein [Bauldia sp.]|nr:SEL1-like repeat protein [Bauldia sp.]
MISGDPSTIPGLSEETRKILEERARRAGRPFGEWLNEMLAADRAARAGSREERAGSGETWTQERVARLKERIDQLSVTRGEPKVGPDELRALTQAVDKMAERIDERPAASETFAKGGRRTPTSADAPTLEMIADALKGLEAEAGRIAARPPAVRPPTRAPLLDPEPLDRRSTPSDNSTLRAAVAEIAARQEVIERARSTPAREAALAERLVELKGEIAALAARMPDADLGRKVASLTDAMREGLAAESRGLVMLKEQLAQLSRAVETDPGKAGEADAIKGEIARIGKLIEEDGASGRAALATLVERLDEQRGALDGIAREATLQSLEAGYRHLIGRLDELQRAMPASEQIRSLSAAVTHIGENLARRTDKADLEALGAGLTEIRAAIGAIGQNKSADKVEAALTSLAGRMDKALAGMPRADLVEAMLDRLELVAERIDSVAAATASPAITGEIERLKEALSEIQLGSQRKIESEFQAIAARLDAREGETPLISQIDERLGDLARGLTHAFLEAQTRSQNKLETEIKALAARIEAAGTKPAILELREHLEDMTEGLALAFNEAQAGASQRLEGQIRELAARLDAQPAGTPGLDELKARLEDVAATLTQSVTEAQTTTYQQLESQIGALAARLDTQPAEAPGVQALRERLDTLAAELRQAFEAQSGSELRLESEMRALTQQVEAGRAESGAVAQLGERLEALAESLREAFGRARSEGNEKLEAEIRALAARIETAEAEAQTVSQLEAEFRVLASRLDEPRIADGPSAADLDLQIRALRARVEAAESANPAISQLEARIEGLSERLSRGIPDATMEETLGRLESLVEQRQAEAVEAAKKAARETVQTLATPITSADESAALVEALTLDLREIRAAAENADQRTAENLDSVQAALDRVVSRLSALEGDPNYAGRAEELGAERESLSAAFAETLPAAAATEEADAEDDAARAGERRADFIAAARRAAQAAAAESAAMRLKSAAETTRGGGPISRLTGIFKNRRRPLVLAAAAVVLAIAAVRLYPEIGQGNAAKGETRPEIVAAVMTPVPAQVPAAARTASLEATAPAATAPRAEALQAAPEIAGERIVAEADAPAAPAAPQTLTFEVDPSILAFAPPELGLPNGTSLPPVIAQGFAPSTARAPAAAAGPANAATAPALPAPAAQTAPTEVAPAPAIPVTPAIDNTMTAALTQPTAATATAATASTAIEAPATVSGMGRLMAAANAGDPFAQFELGDRFAEGRGTTADLAQAALWYERAANGGIAVAQYRLGSLYERGQGVDLDREIAKGWYEKAAAEGNIQAMHNLAVLVAEGVGAEPDITTATEWFLRAGESGVSDSQFNLGVIFARGLGREQDLVQSYKWFALAASAGDREAADRREVVANMLTPDQLAQARAAVLAWRVTPALETANAAPVADPAWAVQPGAEPLEGQDLVRQVQALLAERGYDAGPPDGVIGARTRAAVRDFQRTSGLPVTGMIDNGLLVSLSAQTI